MLITQIITYTIFLPIVIFSQPDTMAIGSYLWGDVTQNNRYTFLVEDQIVKWDIGWSQIEPFEGVYYIPPLVQTNCDYFNTHGYTQFINIQGVPTWARMYPLVSYSPPAPAYIDDFYRAVDYIIEQCNPEYVELFNEPDVTLDSGAFWGTAFGDMPGYYAEVIAQSYMYLKLRYPNVKFVVGALTLGNTQDRVWISNVIDFGLLGDALSFHSYNYNPNVTIDIVKSKYDFLTSITDMPLILSETALLCKPEWVCDYTFRENQAIYAENVFSLSWDNLDMALWYSLNDVGWNNCNMTKENINLRYPAWYELENILEVR